MDESYKLLYGFRETATNDRPDYVAGDLKQNTRAVEAAVEAVRQIESAKYPMIGGVSLPRITAHVGAALAAAHPELIAENEKLHRLLTNILAAHQSYLEANPDAFPDWLDDACNDARAALSPPAAEQHETWSPQHGQRTMTSTR